MRTLLLPIFLLAIAAAPLAIAGEDNTLTPAESKAGWKLLFDGRTFDNWRDPKGENPPGDSWTIEDGCLTTIPKPRITEDLISAKSYKDYTLEWDWKVSEGGNTGVKYRIQQTVLFFMSRNASTQGGFEGMLAAQLATPPGTRESLKPEERAQEYTVAFEFQLIDDLRHPDAKKDAAHQTGALYSMLAAKSRPANPAGEWNHSRLVLHGQHVEHWINGQQVLSASLRDPEGLAALKKRWTNGMSVYEILANAKPEGRLSLQNHGDKAWFKNVKILEQ